MKRIVIICEGPTELNFVQTILQRYFNEKGVYFHPTLIRASRGGIVGWVKLKKQIESHLKEQKDAFVTTFIDYYGINQGHGFPGWNEAHNIPDKNSCISFLEKSMFHDIDSKLQFRFVPYLQLHEFEGLLFNDIEVFKKVIPKSLFSDLNGLEDTIAQNPNPELINDNKETSPSRRLKRSIKGYSKVLYAEILSEEIGIERMRRKSPRFNEWLTKLQNI